MYTYRKKKCLNLFFKMSLALALSLMIINIVWAADDNSLSSLGIITEGVTVSPTFQYDIWEYDVVVPNGTTELLLDPVTTNSNATVSSVEGTVLDSDGTGQVIISVISESGNEFQYVLNVTSAHKDMDPAEAIAAIEETSQVTLDTEVVHKVVETEDSRYVKVDRNSLQEAENTIEDLQEELGFYQDRIHRFMYALYVLIGISVLFLFLIVFLLVRKRDLTSELNEYKRSNKRFSDPAPIPDSHNKGNLWEEEAYIMSESKTKEKKANRNSLGNDNQDDHRDDRNYDRKNNRYNRGKNNRKLDRNSKKGTEWGKADIIEDTVREGEIRKKNDKRQRKKDKDKKAMERTGEAAASKRRGMDYQFTWQDTVVGTPVVIQRKPGSETVNQPYRDMKLQQEIKANGHESRDSRNTRSDSQSKLSSGDTRLYRSQAPARPQEVSRDVTKDLSKLNKAEARALRKAASFRAKKEDSAEKTSRSWLIEGRRRNKENGDEALWDNESDPVQEKAVLEASAENASRDEREAVKEADKKDDQKSGVKIDMIEL